MGLPSFLIGKSPSGAPFQTAASLREQAKAPFLNPAEMANTDAADVVAKLARAPYAARFRAVFGAAIFEAPEDAFDRIAFALERFQLEAPEFAPFDSKYDAFLAGRTTLTTQEMNGLALFNRSDKGNCAACHSTRSRRASMRASSPAPWRWRSAWASCSA